MSKGDYELALSKPGTYTIVFQFLGFKTQTKTIEIKEFPYALDITLLEENISLNEVVISSNENPANRIVRAAIDVRKAQLEKINAYSADFYSKGIIRLKDAAKEIFRSRSRRYGWRLRLHAFGIIFIRNGFKNKLRKA